MIAKHVLRYLKGTVDYRLNYERRDGIELTSHKNYDEEGSVADRKSTSGCCFNLGLPVVSWFSRKQKSVALSSAEVEYLEASLASCGAIWFHKMLVSLFDS